MKYTPKHLKRSALGALSGNWWNIISCYFAYNIAISLLSSLIPANSAVVSLPVITEATDPMQYVMHYIQPYSSMIIFTLLSIMVFSIILSPFRIGFMRSVLSTTRNTPAPFWHIFANPEGWPGVMLASLIKMLLIIAASALPVYLLFTTAIYDGFILVMWFFLIAAINIELALLDYVLADNPGISATAAIKQSRLLIKGHRWHFINMTISFILWLVVCTMSLGFAFFLLEIYFFTTLAILYNRILEDVKIDITL